MNHNISTNNKQILASEILFFVWNDDLETIKTFYGQWKENWLLQIISQGLKTAFYSFLVEQRIN